MFIEGQKVWGDILSSVKSQISASTFKTWFTGSFVLDYKKGEGKNLLIVAVKNSFLKEQIECRYLPVISEILTKRGFLNLEVVFVVSQREKSERSKNGPLFSGVAPEFIVKNKRSDALNTSHTFDNFVVGFSNNLAYLAATQVCGGVGKIYNPLLFYGPTGVGKTHLLQAVGNDVLGKVVDAKVLYVTAEKFTNDYIESLNNKTQQAFRQKYRGVDLLLVDDIQFLAGKESTQDEFFHTFNELYLSGRQIVVASDRHPRELGRLKERLVSRFLGGMCANIGLPDLEMKMAIVKAKCAERNLVLGNDVVSYMAEECHGGARELEGILTSILAFMKLSAGKVTLDDIKSALEKNKVQDGPKPTPGKMIEAVCKHFKIDSLALRGSSRKSSLVLSRQILMFLLRKELGFPLEQIGDVVGGRDHSTVIHGIEKVEKMLYSNQDFKDEFFRIQSLLNK